jgi:hypothetical protein
LHRTAFGAVQASKPPDNNNFPKVLRRYSVTVLCTQKRV